MIRYSKYVETDVPQQETPVKSQSSKSKVILAPAPQNVAKPEPASLNTDTLQQPAEPPVPGTEQLELKVSDVPPQRTKKAKSIMRTGKQQPSDSVLETALPLLTGLEI